MKRTIAFLLCALCSTSFAQLLIGLDAPQDNRYTRQAVWNRPELKPIFAAYNDIIQIRVLLLKLDKQPNDMVLPLFAGDGILLPGLFDSHATNKSHVDFHAIGKIGYLDVHYQRDGETISYAVIYLRADDKFVPLKSVDDFSKRMEWEKPKFAAMKEWLDEYMPITDLGVVELSASSPTRVDLGAGTACIIRTRFPNPKDPFWFYMDLAKETTNTDERLKSMQTRFISRTNESTGFSMDGKFYRLTPKFLPNLN